MSKRKLAIAAGALVVIGGAAAIAAVGHREGRMGNRERMHDMQDFAQAHGPGMGHWGEGGGRWGGRFGRGGMDGRHERDPDMRRGWLSRSLTAEEFDSRLRERFARLDRNSDGVIDATEAEARVSELSERGGRLRGFIRDRFAARFDADRDGKVTRQEALDRVRRQFSRMDLDGDGRITDADLPPMLRGRGVLKGETGPIGRGGPGLGRLIGADANKDGIITLEEALADGGRRFELADRNKDGVLDKADYDAIGKEMTDYRVKRFVHAHGGKDGRVTREQFFAAAKERFAERDLNNDGRIDWQDGWRGRWRGEGRGPGAGPGTAPGGGQDGPGMRDRGPPR